MIDRYLTKEMEGLFSDKSRFDAYLDVEIAALAGWVKLGVVPEEDYLKVKNNAKVNLDRLYEIEASTKHDVVAFTRAVSETLGEERKWVHYGLTSTDVVDTALAVLYKKADDIIQKDLESLIAAVKDKALEYKYTPCIGRTHGMHGEIYSFGLKWATYYDEIVRLTNEFKSKKRLIECAKVSGALGNYANIDPRIQDYVAEELGLESSAIATQVLSRDRHEAYGSVLAILASTYEKMATEIRNLARSEIQECEEGFTKGQKGSSSMPQKRNPISSENIIGGARMMRGYLLPLLEDNALYHERDISHSSVERVALIDMIELFDYITRRMTKVVECLSVYPDNMIRNINLTHGAIFSQRVLTELIAKGAIREEAYDAIQQYAMNAAQNKGEFKDSLLEDEFVNRYLTKEEIKECFTYDYYMKNVDYIYKKVGIE